MTTEPGQKTFHGSCHCGFIKYTATLSQTQLDNPTAGRCNCTICLKVR